VFNDFIVWYLFLAGLGSGSFLVAAATMLGHRRKTHREKTEQYSTGTSSSSSPQAPTPGGALGLTSHLGIARRQSLANPSASQVRVTGALSIAALAMIAASLSLLADFSDPLLTWRVLLNPLSSITSFGAVAVMAFAVLAMLTVLISLLQLRFPHWLFAVILVLGVAAALATMLYAGFLLMLFVSVDLWRSWLIPLLFALSSLACGLAAVLAVEAVHIGIRSPGFSFRWRMLLGLGLSEAVVIAILLVERAAFSPTALASVSLLLLGDMADAFWLGIVVLGLVVPFVAHALLPRIPLQAIVLVSSVAVLVGGFFVRDCIVRAALLTPVISGA
jgi:formate-dependent nitrite reductase membrane component NrfD